MKRTAKRRNGLRGRKASFRPRLFFLRLATALLTAGLCWFGYIYMLIDDGKSGRPPEQADAAIVLGAALWNDRPSPALTERLDRALALYEQGAVTWLVLSGGKGGSSLSEAEGMRNYLLSRGVPEDRLLLEPDSVNTYQNIRFSLEVANEQGLHSFIIVTHDYHAARAGEIAAFAGIGDAGLSSVRSTVLNRFLNESREVLAFTKWRLERLSYKLGLARPDINR